MEIKDLLQRHITSLKNVGPARAAALQKMGIVTLGDLLFYFPRDYVNRTRTADLRQLQKGDTAFFSGIILSSRLNWVSKRMSIIRVMLHCDSETTQSCEVSFFNQPYLLSKLQAGGRLQIYGRVTENWLLPKITAEEFEFITGQDTLTEEQLIVPVYRTVNGVSQKYLSRLLTVVMNELEQAAVAPEAIFPEIFPPALVQRYCFPLRWSAVRQLHRPESMEALQEAQKRFKYEESFAFQFSMRLLKQRYENQQQGISFKPDGWLVRQLLKSLPFELTASQKRVWQEIKADMESSRPLNRLLQGDVGSGKTVLALLALAKAVENGYQGALMVPTEVLAEQHFYSLSQFLEQLSPELVLLTGHLSEKEKRETQAKIAAGRADIIIGTHALLEQKVQFHKLGLIIIDEQHRFGVQQRAGLQFKGEQPDVLIMTATPIPRTLALTLYNDLNISVLTELPAGRKPIKTYWLNDSYLERIYGFIRRQVEDGKQVFVVCPLIAESEHVQAQAAEELAVKMKDTIFPDLNVGLLHGRLPAADKQAVMQAFQRNEISILVATTVIEVGIDVPNAVLMVIYGADRFGLSQLHQLRGRIGRGSAQSYCLLLGEPKTEAGKARLDTMRRTTDGFLIAEADLQIRGPGDFFGTRQAGLLSFKFLDLLHDQQLIEQTKKDVDAVLETALNGSRQFSVLEQACRQLLSRNEQLLNIR